MTTLRSLTLIAILCSGFALQADITPNQTAAQTAALKNIFKEIKTFNKGVPLREVTSTLNEQQTFTEEELLALCELAIKKLRPYDDVVESPGYAQLQAFTQTLVAQLKDYQISGVGFASHSSFNLIYGHQSFDADFVYKNSKGESCTSTANIKYSTFGFQQELVWRFDAIFAVKTDLSRYATRTPLEFNRGFTAGYRLPLGPTWDHNHIFDPQFPHMRLPLSVIGVSVLPLKDSAGSLIIAHCGVGLASILPIENALLSPFAFNLALVMSGGTMTQQATK